MMVSITFPLEKETITKVEHFSWVNWSDIAREELIKREIFDRYKKTRKITDEDWKFCEKTDWHPVDELPLKEKFLKELKERKKGPFTRFKSVDEIFKE